MMRSNWLISISILGLLLVGGALFYWQQLSSDHLKEEPAALEVSSAPSPSAPLDVAVAAFKKGEPLQRVQDLYESESKRIGAIDPDPALTEKRLEAAAKELTKAEVDWLKTQALDQTLEGDARFFATYLVALGKSEASVGALSEIALSPVPVSKNQGLVELERMIRAQAEEGLGKARGVQSARDALLDIIEKQNDEFLRDRAHRALHEWQTGRVVADQDKEALKGTLYKSAK